jgi:hypothetical protein
VPTATATDTPPPADTPTEPSPGLVERVALGLQ